MLTNFDDSTCTMNTAMCCWPKDRQANDNNGNCAKAYDVNCIDKDPADNTDLCYMNMENGNKSNEFAKEDGFMVFPGDNNDGEGAIHCHGFAWGNDENDSITRYKANNLFYVSMYDHMYVRGYVENIPGAPMCGCVEQMPTVSRSDCTQVDLTETIKVVYDGKGSFSGKITSIDVDFNACQGINNRNNDLWAYMARLYYQGDITAAQFGQAGRIITDDGCDQAVAYQLNEKSFTRGYVHDETMWTHVAGRDSLKIHAGYGNVAFTKSLVQDAALDTAPYGILYRVCASCVKTHQKIYYRRLTEIPEGFDLMTNILYRNDDGGGNNVWDVDFSLHSTYEDALNGTNPWECPNNAYNYGRGFGGECSPTGARVTNQGGRFDWSWREDVAYYVSKPEGTGLVQVETNVIKGQDWASGMALRGDDGTIYMTGSGRDIYNSDDDFNYYSEEAEGDHTITVHVSSFTSPKHDSWAKAGIMIRKDLDPSSAHATVWLSSSYGVCTMMRSGAHGGNPDNKYTQSYGCTNVQVASAWLKLEKRMDTYTSYAGEEDESGIITWTQLNRFDVPLIGDSHHVGLAVCSKEWYAAEAVFEDYYVDHYFFPSAAPSTSPAPTIFVPSLDTGNVAIAGSASESSAGSWTVTGSGSDIWGRSDGFHFVNFAETGDVDISVLVDSFTASHSWGKSGLMIRDTLAANSMHYSMFLTGSNGLANQWRSCTGCGSGNSQTASIRPSSVWLRIVKVGNEFQAFYKQIDQDAWSEFGARVTMNFSTTTNFWVGLVVTSHDNSRTATMRASNLEIKEFEPQVVRKLRSA